MACTDWVQGRINSIVNELPYDEKISIYNGISKGKFYPNGQEYLWNEPQTDAERQVVAVLTQEWNEIHDLGELEEQQSIMAVEEPIEQIPDDANTVFHWMDLD